jgi:acetyl/propionyl-CoA carboxylase alpha subunit
LPDDDVRVDAAVEQGDVISQFYDPMIAKIIAHGPSRSEALTTLARDWRTIDAWPVKTNAGFVLRCLGDPRFIAGDVDTALIATRGDDLTKVPTPSGRALSSAYLAFKYATDAPGPRGPRPAHLMASPWKKLTGFRLNASATSKGALRYQGDRVEFEIDEAVGRSVVRGDRAIVFENGEAYEFTLDTGERGADEATAGDGAILSPMPGKIVSVAAKAGAKLKKGDPILVLEAMKMEHTLVAPFDGKLTELNAKAGAQVNEGVLLAKLVSGE